MRVNILSFLGCSILGALVLSSALSFLLVPPLSPNTTSVLSVVFANSESGQVRATDVGDEWWEQKMELESQLGETRFVVFWGLLPVCWLVLIGLMWRHRILWKNNGTASIW